MIGSENNYSIKKSNFAINITNNLTSLQRKFYNHILFEQDQQGWAKPIIQLRTADINYLIGNSDKHRQNHSKIKAILNQLLTKRLMINNAKYEGYEAVCYISYIKINAGYIDVKIDDELKKHLNINYVSSQGIKNTSKGYTSLDLSIINTLNSTYHIALYEFLKKTWYEQKNKKHIEIDINLLRNIATNKQSYDKYKEFHRTVLKPAIQAINEKTDLNIKYELVKYANKVESIVFNIENKVIIAEKIENSVKVETKTTTTTTFVPKVSKLQTLDTPVALPEPLKEIHSWGYSNMPQLLTMYNGTEDKKCQLLAILATINLKYCNKAAAEKCRLVASLIAKNAHADAKAIYDAKTSEVVKAKENCVQQEKMQQEEVKIKTAVVQAWEAKKAKAKQLYLALNLAQKTEIFRTALRNCVITKYMHDFTQEQIVNPFNDAVNMSRAVLASLVDELVVV
jgi:plasmid replication initiation protein